MLKAYVFRLYPNNNQKQMINQTIGNSRFIYNYFLNDKITEYKKFKKSKTAYDQIKCIPSLIENYPWLKQSDSCALRNSIFNLDDAYKSFYNGKGYPKFKNKDKYNSYKTNNIKSIYKGKQYESIKLDLINKIITLPKLKEVKIRGYRKLNKINGIIKSAVIRKEAKKYYVSVLIEEELIKPIFNPKNIVGLDLGIKDLVITSNHEKIENKVKSYNKRLKGLQKALSRAKVGSNNRYKIKLKIQRIYQKIKNARKHLIHNITNKIIKENDIIITENLDIKNMYQNHNIAKSLTNTPLGHLIRILKYKSEWQNKKLIQVDRYYPSSQICSKCGYKNEKVKDLTIRKWECPRCNTKHDRDYNASENILFEGIKLYMKRLQV